MVGSEAALPLAGLTVREFGHSVAAPFAGQVLGDIGAEVVNIGRPAAGGDARAWRPLFWEGAAATLQTLNRNRRSVALDLRDPAQNAAMHDFILARCDMVLQNLRPGQVEAPGLGGEALTPVKPALVYCNLGAFGRTGPLSCAPGYDRWERYENTPTCWRRSGHRSWWSSTPSATATRPRPAPCSPRYKRRSAGSRRSPRISTTRTAPAWPMSPRRSTAACGPSTPRSRAGCPFAPGGTGTIVMEDPFFMLDTMGLGAGRPATASTLLSAYRRRPEGV